ncbi:hypothetical protein TI39_contig384g00001 [Zymoseptoria brevis]|uniref:DUF7729 domain-containing protein n=1 Tax=Zymoseptoria brevis TaxID=1047168 RepID=A0A0F4GNU0_9PEZI|nr:hypothetical protein TI39_contig384g00001 [Zymoseptoria brevis]
MTTGRRSFSSCSSPRTTTPPSVVRHTPLLPQPSSQQPWRHDHHQDGLRNGRRAPSIRPALRRSFSQPNRNVFMLVQNWTLAVLCCILFLSRYGVNAAADVYGTSDSLLPRDLLFDRSEPPTLPQHIPLVARQFDFAPSSSLSSVVLRPTSTRAGSATGTASSASSLATATDTGTFTLPKPFDSSLGNNFTSTTCPDFFNTFLSDQTFTSCLPLSLLLQTSNGFFTASRSLLKLTQILDASCSVDFPTCSNLMASLATQIQQPDKCGPDLKMENPLALTALRGFTAYQPLYKAGCLADSSASTSGAGSSYCYANAATDSEDPESSYIYYLPLGVSLPGGSRPACTTCLKDTMAIFAKAVSSTQVLKDDYVGASQQVKMLCGPNFVDSSVQPTGAASGGSEMRWSLMMGVVAVLGVLMV